MYIQNGILFTHKGEQSSSIQKKKRPCSEWQVSHIVPLIQNAHVCLYVGRLESRLGMICGWKGKEPLG